MKKQTAVEWLADNYHLLHTMRWNEIVEQAKQMEKEQIIEAYCDGFKQGSEGNRILSEEYYNETYNK